MSKQYLPLEIASNLDHPNREFEEIKKMFQKNGISIMDDANEDDWLDFVLTEKFLNPDYRGKFLEINNALRARNDFLKSFVDPGKQHREHLNVKSEWIDMCAGPVLADRWARNKQVYKPDADFAKMLIGTEKLQFTKEQLQHVPADTFFIDYSDCKQFAPIEGALVHVRVIGQKVAISQFIYWHDKTDTLICSSYHLRRMFNDDDILDCSMMSMKDARYYVSGDKEANYTEKRVEECINTVVFFTLQCICYLTSKEPEITESRKSAYRKPTPGIAPKNKYSEIQLWDVGVRYGKTVRMQQESDSEGQKITQESNGTSDRRSPSPHFRSAHWSHYWTGKGRKNRETRWIAPVFVGFNAENKVVRDVVIHRIKN